MSSEGRLVLVGGTEAADDGLRARAGQAIARATQYLVTTQHPHGYWHAPLEANVTMEAEYVFFNRMLGRERADLDRRMAERLLALQGADGSWPQYKDGPGNVSTTIETYFALKLAGLSADEPALARARDFILGHGGLARAGVFTRFWLAYFGQFPWAGLPALPVELVLLPPWFPINIYAMSSWARGTVVPLSLLAAHRPAVRTPPEAALNELWLATPTRADLGFPRSRELITTQNFFLALDRALKLVGQSPWKPFRRRAIARAIEWLVRHQDKNGQWGGIQPAMLNSVLALHAVGFAPDHPAMVSGVQGVDDFLVECEGTLMYQPCVSPTWDTALAMKALLESGMDPAHPMLARAGEWLVANQIFRPGDWSVLNPELEPGGWAFEFANDWFPDVDDSAVIVVGPLGRQLHLRHLVRARRPRRDRRGPARALRAPRRRVAPGAPERRRRLGGDGCLVRRRVARREGGEHGLADGVGAPRAHGRGRGGEPGRAARHRLPRPHAGRGGHLERAPLHRHGLPAPLLPPLPPLPALLPAHGARAVRAAGRRGGEAMSVGIERLQVYVPQYALRLTELAAARDIPPEKLTAGLGVQEMAIAPPCEDVVTLAATAGARLLRAADVDPEEIGMLLVATETGVDHSKPVSIFVHDLLGIGRRCRVYELKHACYAGTAALMTAADWVRAGGGRARRALVIAADLARYEIGSPG